MLCLGWVGVWLAYTAAAAAVVVVSPEECTQLAATKARGVTQAFNGLRRKRL